MPGDETRRLLLKLIRETARSEAQALEHPAREVKRIGPMPPIDALQGVADHVTLMQPRFAMVLDGHGLETQHARGGIAATFASLRHLVVDRVTDPERAYRTALLDLRHGLEVVKLLRENARREMLLGLIRWCDDWLGARRTLVARVEAQLGWFAEREAILIELASTEDLENDFEPSPLPSETDHRDHY
jgi:hypothetical protein